MTKGHNRLTVLAEAIKSGHSETLSCARLAATHAIECGRNLLEAKSLVPHGEWLPWLKVNTNLSERSAQRYMRIVNAKSDTVTDLVLEGLDRLDLAGGAISLRFNHCLIWLYESKEHPGYHHYVRLGIRDGEICGTRKPILNSLAEQALAADGIDWHRAAVRICPPEEVAFAESYRQWAIRKVGELEGVSP